MNVICKIATLICFFPALAAGLAQQTPAQPVLSAAPTPPAPQAAPSKASPEGGPLSLGPNYVIGAEDQLDIEVWQEKQLSGTLTVRPDGKITLPLVKDVMAAGFTPTQLADDITAKLTKFVNDPVVSVSVTAVNSKRIFMIGEVGHAGQLSITPGMTVLQAIAAAGGLSPYANGKRIYILRGDPGKQQKVPFDYNKALKKGDMQGVVLQPNDTIVVP